MFKTQQKIKNPLLKQIGQKNNVNNSSNNLIISGGVKEKKIDLEALLDYIKNLKNIGVIVKEVESIPKDIENLKES